MSAFTTAPTPHPSIMEHLQHRSLLQAAEEKRFCEQDSEYHIVRVDKEQRSSHQKMSRRAHEEKGLPNALMNDHNWRGGSRLRFVLQRERPSHISGKADSLPFRDAATLQRTFDALSLPPSYLQVADGSLTTAQAHVLRPHGKPSSLEMVVYCVAKQGDWSMALSHSATTLDTSVFCSLDAKIQSQSVVDELLALQSESFHPMLIPCIMFDAVLKMGISRRNSIKHRLQALERTMTLVGRRASLGGSPLDADQSVEETGGWRQLFELLNSCRGEQSSRKGRYGFWKTYHDAVQTGLNYSREILATSQNEAQLQTHRELEQWADVTWQKLNSLIARDKDHIHRVENVSTLLYNLVQQREIRLQSSIARATQRDSQDMKFIAVLGSVFLPASLIATILNVPEFQFLPGPQLFGAYIGITLPLIASMLALCITRPQWTTRWKLPVRRRRLPHASRREEP